MSGICAIHGVPDAVSRLARSLHAVQHRGLVGCGFVFRNDTTGEGSFHTENGLVLVRDMKNELKRLRGNAGIGYVESSSVKKNGQLFFAETSIGKFAVALTGNLTDSIELKQRLQDQGAIFQSDTDAEIIVKLVARSGESTLKDKLIDALKSVSGAFSLVILTSSGIIGVRDPYGFRPLVLGKMDCGTQILASETCSFDIIEADYERDIMPGEMVIIDSDGIDSCFPFDSRPSRYCMLECGHISRPDSKCNGESFDDVRTRIGRQLARECPAEADVVIPLPDSAVQAACGYSTESRIPYVQWITHLYHAGHMFLEPGNGIPNVGKRLKYNPCGGVFDGKSVILGVNYIKSGVTVENIVAMLKGVEATQVHVRVASSPIIHLCHFGGIYTPTEGGLLAFGRTVKEMCSKLGADSLAFISIDGLYEAVNGGNNFCDACMTGNYPCSSTPDRR